MRNGIWVLFTLGGKKLTKQQPSTLFAYPVLTRDPFVVEKLIVCLVKNKMMMFCLHSLSTLLSLRLMLNIDEPWFTYTVYYIICDAHHLHECFCMNKLFLTRILSAF